MRTVNDCIRDLVFNANLSKSQVDLLENIQRRALVASLGASFSPYVTLKTFT